MDAFVSYLDAADRQTHTGDYITRYASTHRRRGNNSSKLERLRTKLLEGMLGLSIASVIQLRAINTNTA